MTRHMDSVLVQFGRALLVAWWEMVTIPAWWYTRGLMLVLRWFWRSVRRWEQSVGLGLWARNLLVPMYGQTDWQGRLISFFMRLAVLAVRMVQVIVGTLFMVLAVFCYIVFPPAAIFMMVRSFLA
ncbi:MAG: hypothetical protein Q7T01_02215 [bacterium]|nr:hypothetical protein [bacterium]